MTFGLVVGTLFGLGLGGVLGALGYMGAERWWERRRRSELRAALRTGLSTPEARRAEKEARRSRDFEW